MRACFLCFFSVFVVTVHVKIESVAGVNNLKHEQNIGTVLFEKGDVDKHCWTAEEFVILNSRRMFQDLLPKAKALNYENDQYISVLMDYFHNCLESVRKLSIGRTKHLMLKALADTIGGYLQVYILPLTRHSYYAGNIKYQNAKKLFDMYEQLKTFLRSNGAGWFSPSKEIKHVKIPPIVITPSRSSIACDGLVVYSATSGNSSKREARRIAFEKKKKLLSKHKRKNGNTGKIESITVPLPFLDDNEEPSSIALPFKKDNLQSLYSEKSAFVLVKYYVASVKCIVSKSKGRTELDGFNQQFYDWLQQSVVRHLDDDKWYPAFGGVLRVITSLEDAGAESGFVKGLKTGSNQMIPKLNTEISIGSMETDVLPLYKEEDVGITLGTSELISIAVVSALLVWLLVGLSLVCYRYLTKHPDECSPCEPPDSSLAFLYKNEEYCEREVHPSQTDRKGWLNKFRDFFKIRFGKCRRGCDETDEERCLAAISYTSKESAEVNNTCRNYHRRKVTKSATAALSNYRKERPPMRRVYYSSDCTLTTNTESPVKPRQ